MKNTTETGKAMVAGVFAPAPRPTAYAMFLIASLLSAVVALPLWAWELWLSWSG